jgi:hypothetical protein
MKIGLKPIGIVFMAILLLFVCGCTSPDDFEPPLAIPEPQAPAPTYAVTEEILLLDPLMEGISVTFDAVEGGKSSDNLLITYTIDASKNSGQMTELGFDIRLTAFAYNYASVDPGFAPESYQDIIDASIPYKSTRLRLYPGNIYRAMIEPEQAPNEERVCDLAEPYNYGLAFTVVGE